MYPFAKQQQQKMKNRRSKQNSPGGGFSLLNSQQYSEKILNVAFNSLPPMHIGDTEPLLRMFEGAHSRSCPLPNLTSPLKAPTPTGRGLLPNPAKRKFFAPHWSDQAVEEAIEKGNAFRATFRVNAYNCQEAYCTIDGVPVDVLINGIDAQNRAIEGDVVAITLDPVAYWTKLKGSNAPLNPVIADDSNSTSEFREVGENSACQEQMDANGLFRVARGYIENGSTSESLHTHLDNGSETTRTMSEGHKFMVAECSNSCPPEQDEAARALARICAMVNSCPSKRPTGRLVSILRKSSHRGAVIGFLSTGGEHGMKSNELKKNWQISDYVQLLPTDTKFPKMVVSVSSLPDLAKEKLFNGDASLERELIAAQIDEWSDESPLPKARVIHILGRGGEIESQIAAILFQNAISDSKFSSETLECIPNLPWDVPEKEFQTRNDLRNVCTFTIDPSSATDLDDALSVEILSDETFRIGVHITDVSYFVLPDTALDAEAQIRSTSVYIRQHRLSMLPRELSQGLCSLLPGADRLAFSVTWDITRSGKIVNRWFGRSIIQSCCKLSYELVQEIIDGSFVPDQCNSGSSNPKLHGQLEWKDVISSLRSLYEISLCLRKNRFQDGALWLDSSKLGFSFDEYGTPYDIFLHDRKDSCFLVEEFMLLANMSVAQVISTVFPDCALLRRHPEPNLRKLRDFEAFCSKHGFDLDTSSSGQFHLSLSKIRKELTDDPVLFDILVSYASKPMQPAAYFCTGELKGRENDWAHYALSVPFYTHFTSPIRRYPDIVVHRTLSAVLDAEEEYMKKGKLLPCSDQKEASGSEFLTRCFTGLYFNKEAAESNEGRKILTAAALKFKVPGCEVLSEVAAYCNDRKLASRHAEKAGNKLYLWALLKKKEILVCEARVLGLGPRFMSVYIHKFGIERRINYDEVEGLSVEWLDTTSTLVLDLLRNKKVQRRVYNSKKLRPIVDAALVVYPFEESEEVAEKKEASPAIFPLILRNLSTVPIALHAIGGDDGPIDVGVLYMCSYFSLVFFHGVCGRQLLQDLAEDMKSTKSAIQDQSILYEESLIIPALPTTLFTQSVGYDKDVKGIMDNGTHPNAIEPNRINHYAMYNSKEGVYRGVRAFVQAYGYLQVMKDQLSSGLIWVVNGLDNNFNSVQAGWHVYPGFYGDNEAHFFTYWTADGYKNTGCYNLKCPGFVLDSATLIKPGDIMQAKNLHLKISQDPKTADWWLYGNNRPVGHWPKMLFSSLANGASHVALGGMVSFIKNTSSPPMGTGKFPYVGGYPAVIYNIEFVDAFGGDKYPNADDFVTYQDATCYRVGPILDSRDHFGYFFSYGGPGHCLVQGGS